MFSVSRHIPTACPSLSMKYFGETTKQENSCGPNENATTPKHHFVCSNSHKPRHRPSQVSISTLNTSYLLSRDLRFQRRTALKTDWGAEWAHLLGLFWSRMPSRYHSVRMLRSKRQSNCACDPRRTNRRCVKLDSSKCALALPAKENKEQMLQKIRIHQMFLCRHLIRKRISENKTNCFSVVKISSLTRKLSGSSLSMETFTPKCLNCSNLQKHSLKVQNAQFLVFFYCLNP